ncbi:MAG TPA: mandelate racemase/muconate lactonizing enzyme family protein [Chloroflexi bacterium]|jgi:galactonate dehydratase|nr:mandelate racemase/muconate lactonizing enzyme family protein [Chloroflexota bacterium]
MKITEIRTGEVFGHGYSCFVRIYTDKGLTGTGECIHGGAGIQNLVASLGSLILGEDPMNVDRLYEKMRRARVFDGAAAGNLVTALTGIEIALWDLVGKATGLPVYALLGGAFRQRIRMYVDCHAGGDDSPAENAAKAREVVDMGFTALKFDLDDLHSPHKHDPFNHTVSQAELDAMVAKVAAVREAVGPHIDVAMDLHGRYDTGSGIRIAQALEEFNLLWLEEPVPPENMDALREVKQSTRTPICAGENQYLRWGFREMLEKQAVDIIMPDLPKCCGLSEGKKIANMAEVYYIPMAPHNVCGPLGTIASCHCCAAIPNFLVLEWHWLERPHWHELVRADPPLIQDGYITLSDRPGLGVELDEEAAEKHLRPGTRLFA